MSRTVHMHVLDCFLYEGAYDYYLAHKPLSMFREYVCRAKRVWAELGIPQDPRFQVLDGYRVPWFSSLVTLERAVQ
jgi:hypothetical protein